VVEAMSQACPVITRKNTSLPEVGGEAAVYYDDTTRDLVQQMLRLEEQSRLYIELSERALAQARRFSWAKTAAKVLELYEQVLRKEIARKALTVSRTVRIVDDEKADT
jgi:glycosyltransferase involved in cell wall biosynthesis